MIRTTSCALAIATLLLGSAALAQAPKANPTATAKAATPPGKPGDKGNPEAKPDKPGPSDKASDKAHEKAEDKAQKPDDKGGKPDDKGGKPDDKAGEKPGATPDPANRPADPGAQGDDAERQKLRVTRKKTQKEALRARVVAALKQQPMTEAMKQELKRHARRVARLERIQALARAEKDDAALARATKLLEKETARHDKWIANFDAKADQKVGAK